jgi:RNA polymerase sigma-70 factor (ECF subfamily)
MDQSSKQLIIGNARLMLKAAESNNDTFKRLYKKYAPLLKQFFVMRGVDSSSADDFVQKIFTRLWEKRKSIRIEASFEAYLFSITKYTLYTDMKRSHRITGISSIKRTKYDVAADNILSRPEADFFFQELNDALEVAKAKLTDVQLQALEVSQKPDISFYEALDEFGCSKEAYKKRLKRARERLRELMAPFFTDEKRLKKGSNQLKNKKIEKIPGVLLILNIFMLSCRYLE